MADPEREPSLVREPFALAPSEPAARLAGAGGIALLGAVALLVHLRYLPDLSIAIPALLLGAIAARLPGLSALRASGQRTYGFWLQVGAVLLGPAIDPAAIPAMGLLGLALVLSKIALAYLASRILLRRVFSPMTARLLGIGNSVCGVNAILLAKTRIGATDTDAAAAVGAILLVGTLAVFLAPVVALHWHPAPYIAGAVCGLGVDNTAEAIAAGSAFGPIGLEMATMFKLTRNALLGVVVSLSGREARSFREIVRDFPPFVAGYAVLAALRLLGLIGPVPAAWAAMLSQAAFALAFVGVGAMLLDEISGGNLRDILLGSGYLILTLALSAGLVLLVGP